MKALISLAFYFILSYTTAAQAPRLSMGVSAGLGFPGFLQSIRIPQYLFKASPFFGTTGEYRINYQLSLATQVNFLQADGLSSGMQSIPARSVTDLPNNYRLYADYTSELKINYLEMPLLMRFSYNERVFFDVGTSLMFLISANRHDSGNSYLYLYTTKNQLPLLYSNGAPIVRSFYDFYSIKDDLQPISLGVVYGTGIGYELWKGELIIDARFYTGLTDAWKLNDEKKKLTYISIGMAYNYTLTSRKIR